MNKCFETSSNYILLYPDFGLDEGPIPEGKAWLASDRDYTYDEVRLITSAPNALN